MENTMLIVDDAEVNREILKLLFHSDYAILEAEDGEEALAVLERCRGSVDIVLLDLMMPRLSGMELLRKKRELDCLRDVPVVVITSSGALDDQIKAFEYGASDFVVKPFVPEIVESRVNNVMASHQRILTIEQEAQKLRVKSEVDEMTGLYNKVTSEVIINELLKKSERELNVLMIIDIDNFKIVNDTSGHLAGDHVIKIIADLLSSTFRKTDVVGRIGGDEFIVLMTDLPTMDIAYTKANALIQTMRYKPNLTIPEYVTLSVGLAVSRGTEHNYTELFGFADQALYLAKQDGKARFREYGVEPINLENDQRPALLLLSNNRSVCGTAHTQIPAQVRMLESLDVDGLNCVSARDQEKVALACVDVSDQPGDGGALWKQLEAYPWIRPERTFAVCQEGSTAQYAAALRWGVADLLTEPLDAAAFKRRVLRQLEKLGLTQVENQ